jgi:hypothetical protein
LVQNWFDRIHANVAYLDFDGSHGNPPFRLCDQPEFSARQRHDRKRVYQHRGTEELVGAKASQRGIHLAIRISGLRSARSLGQKIASKQRFSQFSQ